MRTLTPRAAAGRPTPEQALRVATARAPEQPPTRMQTPDRPATLNLRLRQSTIASLMTASRARGQTMKQLMCRALADAGVEVAPADLEDRTPRRRT